MSRVVLYKSQKTIEIYSSLTVLISNHPELFIEKTKINYRISKRKQAYVNGDISIQRLTICNPKAPVITNESIWEISSTGTNSSNIIGQSIAGASRNSGNREKHDFYPTDPWVVYALLSQEEFIGKIWEPACATGNISKVFIEKGYEVISTDLIYRGFGYQLDFLIADFLCDNIVSNPPFKLALEFIEHAKKLANHKIAFLLKTVFLESLERYEMFQDKEFPLKTVYQFSKRVTISKSGIKLQNAGMISFAWFVWERGYHGEPFIKWIKESFDDYSEEIE